MTQERSDRAGFGVISGSSGTGKTGLATHWAHRVKDRFPDGQVHVDLASGERSLDDAAQDVLRELGVKGADIPEQAEARISLLRTRTADKRLLILLDDVPDPDAAERLRSSSPGSVLLCTSFRDASASAGQDAVVVRLDALSTEHVVQFLRSGFPSGTELSPEDGAELARHCGCLPATMRVAAGQLRKHGWTVPRALRELTDPRRRQRHLKDHLAVVDLAVEHLRTDEAELYALLSLFPGPAAPAFAAAALADADELDAELLLADLHEACLVERNDREQYLFHDVVREHAEQRAAALDPDERVDALRRLVARYRELGAFADRAVTTTDRLRVGDIQVTGDNPFTGKTEALEWLEGERLNLLALQRLAADKGWHRDVVALAEGALWALHNQHKYFTDALRAFRLGADAAAAAEDAVAEARMLSLHGQVRIELGRPTDALQDCERAVQLAERAGHREVLASAIEFRGKARSGLGEHEVALADFRRSHELNLELADTRGVLLQEYLAGRELVALGRAGHALDSLRSARERLALISDEPRLAQRIDTAVAAAHRMSDEHVTAVDLLHDVLTGVRARGATGDLAEPLELLADSLTALSRPGAADHLREALQLLEQSGDPRADRVRTKLAELG
nr:NB-ARC domain-containing protein [Saccharopolyspora sp. HNM0983]